MVIPPSGTAAIYARSATSKNALQAQQDVCEQYLLDMGLLLTQSYSDAGQSGRSLTSRKGMSDMLAAAERGEFKVLVVDELARLSRNAAGLNTITARLKELGVTLCTTSRGPVTGIEAGIYGAMLEQFRQARTARSIRVASRKQAPR